MEADSASSIEEPLQEGGAQEEDSAPHEQHRPEAVRGVRRQGVGIPLRRHHMRGMQGKVFICLPLCMSASVV